MIIRPVGTARPIARDARTSARVVRPRSVTMLFADPAVCALAACEGCHGAGIITRSQQLALFTTAQGDATSSGGVFMRGKVGAVPRLQGSQPATVTPVVNDLAHYPAERRCSRVARLQVLDTEATQIYLCGVDAAMSKDAAKPEHV
jgi:hypothetical protein